MRRLAAVSTLVVFLAGAAGGDVHKQDGEARKAAIHSPGSIQWVDVPPILPAGAKMAVLEGDPRKPGHFVMRVKMPDGYRVAPHTHPKPERVTVIAGTFHIGMGSKFDARKARAMPAGTYGTWPAGMEHFAWTKGETIIQLHGTGPWTLTYVNPEDDPRNKGK